MIISSYSVLQGPTRETCSQRWREGYQSLEQIIQTIFIKVCAKRICSKTFNILVHVSFATTYVNSQLQNYSDAKGGAMQWSPMCDSNEAKGWNWTQVIKKILKKKKE